MGEKRGYTKLYWRKKVNVLFFYHITNEDRLKKKKGNLNDEFVTNGEREKNSKEK